MNARSQIAGAILLMLPRANRCADARSAVAAGGGSGQPSGAAGQSPMPLRGGRARLRASSGAKTNAGPKTGISSAG